MKRKELLNKLTSLIAPSDRSGDDARQILTHVLNISHADLLAHDDKDVSLFQKSRAIRMAKARSRNTPMAYLLGSRSFFGRQFAVNDHSLIPRPETEIMVEESVALSDDNSMFIDVGVGSGAIAITLNLETSRPVIGTDISKRALKIAKKNAHKLKAQVDFHEGSLLEPIWPNELKRYERVVITANLPYLSEDMWKTSPDEVKDYEPKVALVSDASDGLDLYRELMMQINSRRDELPKELFVLLEIDPRQDKLIKPMLGEVAPGVSFEIKNDLAGKPRVVILTF
ncbi:MAG TPA: peptide chain release factor N(5)-glutamine methyltransferase [Patescibacteria group bacterium]|nr:peptide chain release factor N(5)-glutamine methyltransferase [Patescibacteria group bacterium]